MEYYIPQIWHVNKNIPEPLFKQLAESIKWSIYNDADIKPGWQLPPIKDLAKALEISEATVRSSYKLLEAMGLVITRPHHGTEVLEFDAAGTKRHPAADDGLMTLLRTYRSQGLTNESILDMVRCGLLELENDRKILFVECDPTDEETLAVQLANYLKIHVDFMLLDTFSDKKASGEITQQFIAQYDAIVTSYFHYARLMQECASFGTPVLAVVTEFNKNTMLKIAKFKPGTKIAILCRPKQSPGYLVSIIEGIRDDLEIRTGFVTEENEQKELIQWADVCFPNHPCEQYVKKYAPTKPVYFFCDQINAQSIGILNNNLNALHKQSL